MPELRLCAIDGSVWVDVTIACKHSALLRDLFDACDDGITEVLVPFHCDACKIVVGIWVHDNPIRATVQPATRGYVVLLCTALDFAHYAQSDYAAEHVAIRLRGALATLPLPLARPRPRPVRQPKILPPDSSFPATHDPRMRAAWKIQEWKTVERLMLEGRGLAEVWRLHTLRSTPSNVKRLISNIWDRDLSKWPTDGYDEAVRLMGGDAKEFFAYDAEVGLTPFVIDVLARQVAKTTTKVDPLILTWLIRTSGCNMDHTVNPNVARLMCEMEEPFGVLASWYVRHAASDEVLVCAAEFVNAKHDDGITQRLFNGGIKSTDDVHRLLSLGLNAPYLRAIIDFAYTQRIESHQPIIIALLEVVNTNVLEYHPESTVDQSRWMEWFIETKRRIFQTRKLRDAGVDEGTAKRALAALARV